MHSLKIRGAEQNSNLDESITDESKKVNSYSESRRALPSCGGRTNAYILTRKKPLLYIREQGSQCPRYQTKATAIYSANLKHAQIEWQAHRTAY